MSIMPNVSAVRSLRAGATLFATVVGVGVFALPYVFARAGFFVGLVELIVLAIADLLLLLMYAEITVQTPGRQRFAGYIGRYLGSGGATIAAAVFLLSMFGSLLAFTALGGEFLSVLTGWPQTVSAGCVAVVGALLTTGGLKAFSRLSVYFVLVIVGLYAALIVFAAPAFHVENLLTISPSVSALVLPYGVILFALAGLGAVPEMHDLLERRYRHLPKVLMGAYAGIVSLYGLFAFMVVGASGAATTADAISGLAAVTHPMIIAIGTVLGLVSVVSIRGMVQIECIEALVIDSRIHRRLAWVLVAIVPFLAYLAGARVFVQIIGFVGGVLVSATSLLVIVAYERMKRQTPSKEKKTAPIPTWVSCAVAMVFVLGMILAI